MRVGLPWFSLPIVVAFAALACGGSAAQPSATAPAPLAEGVSGGVYLALGDSLTSGQGASDPARTGFVALIEQTLRSRFGDDLELQSLAIGGHTTKDLIDHQLGPAVERLRDGDVRVVTLSIGGNDLFQYSEEASCVENPADPACPVEAGLRDVEQRLDLILGNLREAGPEAAIVILAYPNLFSGSGHEYDRPAEIAFDLLNGVIVTVAARHDVLVADPRRAFAGQGSDLTHILDREVDFHPNDEGYRVIADAFLEVLGLAE